MDSIFEVEVETRSGRGNFGFRQFPLPSSMNAQNQEKPKKGNPSMSERLDRIEAILATVAQQQQQAKLQIAKTRRIIDATARSMAANSDLVAANARNSAAKTRKSIDDVVQMMKTASAQAQEDRQRSDQRFNAFWAKAEEDRQHNDQAHQAFIESFQAQLAEIAKIRQRLSA